MKYACLVYCEEHRLGDPAGASLEFESELRSGVHLLASAVLQSAGTAVTVRLRQGRAAVADGPFDKSREELGAIVLIEAEDLNQAIQLASRHPFARLGCVEVRPLQEC
jgi:hypothetical protein